MSNQVYANNMEVSCKQAAGKAVCAFPDVCFTPPQTPATPPGVPIPYPNTGMASDCTDGSTTVKVSGQEVMLKNKSYFKKSMGDEAGSAPKKGVMTSKNTGKVFFTKWSMDVKFEGENVVRHLDLTTHNHGSTPNTGPWLYADEQMIGPEGKCSKEAERERDACKDCTPNKSKADGGVDPCEAAGAMANPATHEDALAMSVRTGQNACLRARRCVLQPYTPNAEQKGKGQACCPGQTPHHLFEASSVLENRTLPSGETRANLPLLTLQGVSNYGSGGQAPCVCAEGTNQNHGTHSLMHGYQSWANRNATNQSFTFVNQATGATSTVTRPGTTYGKARNQAIASMQEVYLESKCSEECLKAQLDKYHNDCGIQEDTPVKAVQTPKVPAGDTGDYFMRRFNAIRSRLRAVIGRRA